MSFPPRILDVVPVPGCGVPRAMDTRCDKNGVYYLAVPLCALRDYPTPRGVRPLIT